MADHLIACVSTHPVLFDKTNKNYKDNDMKDNVWRSIANQLGYHDFEDAKKLWKNLRDTYVRKRREEKETKSGQAGKQEEVEVYGVHELP
ncbi:transcription factor Adf-1-like [Megalobrama amblycephala]|uniref:transcription factor Adf-1-like n=1 Tax=Megalobrama amblycephala TaxID=75352 RepID=UPI002013F29C|nr:transcription factor Adf-1-like [Megalobrama amblycephala]